MRRLGKALFAAVALLLALAGVARAQGGWTCGAWGPDASGRCEETRACTRRVCSDIDKADTCQSETRTECANPKSSAPPAAPPPPVTPAEPPPGEMPPPGPPTEPSMMPPGGGGTPPQAMPLNVGCVVRGNRIFATNPMSDRIVPKGTMILWQAIPVPLAGRRRLAEDLPPGQAVQIAKVPFALQCTASIVQQ